MNLDNVTAELRPRNPWEATDFGARMIRRDAAAIYKVWFAITLPMLALTILAMLYTPYAAFATFLYWWLEPLTDGPILDIIAHRLFGQPANVKSSLRSTFAFAKRNRIFLLSPYRLHFARSTAMPVTQLEGLKGKARSSRAKILNRRIMNYGTGVTVAYQHLFLALYFGLMLLIYFLIPEQYQDTLGEAWFEISWGGGESMAPVVTLLLFYAAQSALHPWFVGAGFGLYINCRTELEAWDIEIAFRRMVQRRQGLATAALLLICILSTPFLVQPATAQEEPANDVAVETDPGFAGFWSEEEIRPALDVVLQSEALNQWEKSERWQKIDKATVDEDGFELGSGWAQFFNAVALFLATLVEFGLWLGLAGLLLLLFATRQHWLPYLNLDFATTVPRQRVFLAGGEVTAASLPDDVPGEAMRRWREGRHREALSLLYRGAVFAAVRRYGVRLPQSATEGDCIDAVSKQTAASHADYFRSVVAAWMWCAYASHKPDEPAVKTLCDQWSEHYGSAT